MIKEIYHGSKDIIEKPIYGFGKINNDYGLGFYCTEEINLAKEWSVSEFNDGFVNKYELDFDGLKVLNLSSKEYNVLNWITLLLHNRIFNLKNDVAKEGKEYLINNYSINIDEYDVIIGYRADDSYFSLAQDFLMNAISLSKLEEALILGNLGEQIVLKTEKAFKNIKYIESIKVESSIYYPLRKERNDKARLEFFNIKKEKRNIQGPYLVDIMRGELK